MTGQHWHAVIRVWATAPVPSTDPEAEPGETEEQYVWRHDGGTMPVDTEPAVLVATLRALADDIERIAGLRHPGLVEVVTRYGGHKHLARRIAGVPIDATGDFGRHHTLCMGTSSWTVESWVAAPDHPLLTTEQIRALPPCDRCLKVAS